MPRPRAPFLLRPSRRTILLACILLLVGAVVNVAVAWVLVGAPDSWTPGRQETVFDRGPLGKGPPPTEERVQRVTAQLTALSSRADIYDVFVYRGVGWTQTGAHALDPQSERWTGLRTDAGWPLRSLTVLTLDRGNSGRHAPLHTASLAVPRWWLQNRSPFRYRDRLPLTPIPAGFAINTLFYAAILALPLSVFPIRRRLRARRGRCPACGYDLTGAPAPRGEGGGVCPECGAGRRDVAPPPQAEGLDRK